ncbi:hypothetical protein BLNAU_2492 [Blattamonas nauphoetae]|uniref:Flavodoxin-like domain-containing protein n=1 Tax=Blattamonas nauphoetae TaxID=2049346 RepID=A0ABQ9YGD7_9EUKA|nr:hypothetical protein BLNAU_2492 [Blattamonas nauphoetae]
MKNILILYFSSSGYTQTLAEQIKIKLETQLKDRVSVTIERLQTSADNLPGGNLSMDDYKKLDDNTKLLKQPTSNIADFDCVCIGAPVWYYTFPRFLNPFLNSLDGKNYPGEIFMFTTAHSAFGSVEEDFAKNVSRKQVATLKSTSSDRQRKQQVAGFVGKIDSYLSSH